MGSERRVGVAARFNLVWFYLSAFYATTSFPIPSFPIQPTSPHPTPPAEPHLPGRSISACIVQSCPRLHALRHKVLCRSVRHPKPNRRVLRGYLPSTFSQHLMFKSHVHTIYSHCAWTAPSREQADARWRNFSLACIVTPSRYCLALSTSYQTLSS